MKFEIEVKTVKYTAPALYIPKTNNKPDLNKRWYVWFRYDGKLYTFKKGINRFKTIAERKQVGKGLCAAYLEMLQRGWDPGINNYKNDKKDFYTLERAIKTALANKKLDVREKTFIDYEHRANKFLEYCRNNFLLGIDINNFEKKQFAAYLDHVKKQGASNTSINNNRRVISALFSNLVQNYIIKQNPIQGLVTVKSEPIKNTPFTSEQIKSIYEYLELNEPYLIDYIQFIIYALLRPIEITRIQKKDVRQDVIRIKTKTSNNMTIKVIDKLKPIVNKLYDAAGNDNDYLFTKHGTPGTWNVSEISKYEFFQRRFKAVKDQLQLGSNYGLYSFRHSAIYALYTSYINDGLTHRESVLQLLPITRHRTEKALNAYLRDIGAQLPADYGHRFNFDF